MLFSTFFSFFGLHGSGSPEVQLSRKAPIIHSVDAPTSFPPPPASLSSTAANFGDDDNEDRMQTDVPSFAAIKSDLNEPHLPPFLSNDYEPVEGISTVVPDIFDAADYEFRENDGDDELNYLHGRSRRFAEGRSRLQSKMPTFSAENNEMVVTDDHERYDLMVTKVLKGYSEDSVDDEDDENDEVEAGMSQDAEESGSDREDIKREIEKKKRKVNDVSNEEAKRIAIASGVKVRDFAQVSDPSSQAQAENVPSSETVFRCLPVPTVFRAHTKALEFQYIRYLLKHDVLDFPHVQLSPDDVHRLYICGFVKARHWDTFLLCTMLSTGASIRRLGINPHEPNRILPLREYWTIPKNSRPPTRKEIQRYIVSQENRRYAGKKASGPYVFAASERPELTDEYVAHRLEVTGMFGLSDAEMPIWDGVVVDQLLMREDASFIPPSEFPGRLGLYSDYLDIDDSQYANLFDETPASSQAGPSASFQDKSPGISEPKSPDNGTGNASQGRKRARSNSPEEDADGPSRRTRARLSSESGMEIDTPGASSSVASVTGQHYCTCSSASRGKKRARDDDEDDEEKEESIPIKKLKTLTGHVAVFSTAICVLGLALPIIGVDYLASFVQPPAIDDGSEVGPIPGSFVDSESSQPVNPVTIPTIPFVCAQFDDPLAPHPPAPAPLRRQNAFYAKGNMTFPVLSGRYELPAWLL